MYVKGYCRKCGGEIIFDVSDRTPQQIEDWMKKTMFGHCGVGWHVEIGNMIDYYVLDWNTLSATEDEAQSKQLTIEKVEY